MKLSIITKQGKINLRTIALVLGFAALIYFVFFTKVGVGDWHDMLRHICSNNS